MKKMKNHYFYLCIYLIVFVFLLLLYLAYIESKTKENFGIGDITGGLEKIAGDAGGGITDIKNQVRSIVNDQLKSFTGKLVNVIVQPIKGLVYGIGGIFISILNILILIGNKIASLPNCIPFYFVDSIIATVLGFFKYFLPGFIYDFFTNVYNWTLGIFVNWFLNLIGWTDADKKCYAFNIDSQVKKMNDAVKNIGRSFTSSFGKF